MQKHTVYEPIINCKKINTNMGLRIDPLMNEMLDYLVEGRATTGALVDWTGTTRVTVTKRLDKLKAAECIKYAHEPTALWVLVDDPRDGGDNKQH